MQEPNTDRKFWTAFFSLQIIALLAFTLLQCAPVQLPGQSPGKPLEPDVYQIRLQEMFHEAADKAKNQDLEHTSGYRYISRIEFSEFKDVAETKVFLVKALKILDETIVDLNSITPPLGFELKHTTFKKTFMNFRELSQEILSFSDEPQEFGKQVKMQWPLMEEKVNEIQKMTVRDLSFPANFVPGVR